MLTAVVGKMVARRIGRRHVDVCAGKTPYSPRRKLNLILP